MIKIYINGTLRLAEPWRPHVDLRDEIGNLIWQCTVERARCAVVHESGNIATVVART